MVGREERGGERRRGGKEEEGIKIFDFLLCHKIIFCSVYNELQIVCCSLKHSENSHVFRFPLRSTPKTPA